MPFLQTILFLRISQAPKIMDSRDSFVFPTCMVQDHAVDSLLSAFHYNPALFA